MEDNGAVKGSGHDHWTSGCYELSNAEWGDSSVQVRPRNVMGSGIMHACAVYKPSGPELGGKDTIPR